MVKVEVILGIVASSIAITALARAIENIREGRRAREAARQESQQEMHSRREISPPE